jgi:hypothetical protein
VTQIYFLAMTIGFPLLVLLLAILSGHFYRGGPEELLDWKPTRSPELEAKLQVGDVEQMLAAQNRYRRARGAPERSLDEVTEHAWARLEEAGEMQAPEELA